MKEYDGKKTLSFIIRDVVSKVVKSDDIYYDDERHVSENEDTIDEEEEE